LKGFDERIGVLVGLLCFFRLPLLRLLVEVVGEEAVFDDGGEACAVFWHSFGSANQTTTHKRAKIVHFTGLVVTLAT